MYEGVLLMVRVSWVYALSCIPLDLSLGKTLLDIIDLGVFD